VYFQRTQFPNHRFKPTFAKSMPGATHLIINPSSSGGKTRRRLEGIRRQLATKLGGEPALCITTRPGEATDLARRAIADGSELILVAGGDGTVHEVVNGFSIDGRSFGAPCSLGIIGSGTAQDAVRSFGLPSQTVQQIEVATGPHSRNVDIGVARFSDGAGGFSQQFFLNECQQGIAAVVVQRFQDQHKWLGGFLGFGLTAVSTAARHREQVMTVEVDGKQVASAPLLGVVVANGGFAGGGMNFAPRARVDDGLFDIVLIHKQNIPSRLVNFPRIYFGTHVRLDWISYYQGSSVRISSEERVPVESDGEFLGYLPCEIAIRPGALRLKSR
jgi:diacylglycerol kinase (ATP)